MDQQVVEFRGSRWAVAPATCAQRQMWGLIQERLPDSGFYNQVYPVELPMGPSSAEVFAALGDLVGAYESLRTVFALGPDGVLTQYVQKSGTFTVHVSSVEPGQDPRDAFRTWDRRMRRIGYRFAVDQPFRALVVVAGDVPVLAAVCVSHITADLMSLRVLTSELVARVRGLAVPGGSRQPAEHAAFERSATGQRVLARSLAYWRRQVTKAPPPVFSDKRSGRNATMAMDSRAVALALPTLAIRYNVSTGAVLLAAGAWVLGSWAGLSRVAIRLLVANRFAPDLRNAVANLHQEIPVTIDVGQQSFEEVARSTLRAAVGAYSRGHYDPDAVAELVREHHAEEAFPACFNDIRESRSLPAGCGDSVRAALEDTVVAPHWFQEAEPFFLMTNDDEPGWIRFLLSTDTAVMPPAEAHRFLLEVEEVLVREASTVHTLR